MIKETFKIGVLALSTLLIMSSCENKTQEKKTTETESSVVANTSEKIDTGVGKNGIAKASNPAFIEKGGEVATMDNIVRAETAKYFAAETIETGTNKFRHERNGIQLDNQTVIRSNFDLIYSYAIYDISGGIEISVPKYDLYQIVHVFDENSVTIAVVYPGQTVNLAKEDVSYGNHVYLFMRTQPRTYDEKGMVEVRKRQDAVAVSAGSSKPYVSDTKYDVNSFNKLRSELITRAVTEGVINEGFVDNIKDAKTPQYQMINLAGWGGLPAKHAFYYVVLPSDEAAKNGEHSSVTFSAPDLQYNNAGYWSITMYDKDGWVKTNPFNMSSLKVKPNEDGTITLNFNGSPSDINNIRVTENWNALFRCYLPVSVENILAYKENFVKNNKVLSVKK